MDNESIIFNKITKYLSIRNLTMLSIFFGAISIRGYLLKIGRLDLFSDILNLSTVFISMSIVYFIFIGILLFIIYYPFVFFIKILSMIFKEEKLYAPFRFEKKFLIIFWLMALIKLWLDYLFTINSVYSECLSLYFKCIEPSYIMATYNLIIPLLLSSGYVYYLGKKRNKSLFKHLPIIFISFLSLSITLTILTAFRLSFSMEQGFYAEINVVIAFFLIVYFTNIVLFFILLFTGENKNLNKSYFLSFIYSLLLLSLFSMTMPTSKSLTRDNILYYFGYIENSKDSKLYLISNDFLNSFTKEPNNKVIIKSLLETQQNASNYPQFDKYPGSLYGYMALNAGEYKVFCPWFVDGDNNKEYNRCLTIEKKYIQQIPTPN